MSQQDGIIQMMDGENPVYPRTKGEAVFLNGDTAKTLPKELGRLQIEIGGNIISGSVVIPSSGAFYILNNTQLPYTIPSGTKIKITIPEFGLYISGWYYKLNNGTQSGIQRNGSVEITLSENLKTISVFSVPVLTIEGGVGNTLHASIDFVEGLKELLDTKVPKSDIADNLTTDDANKVLSAKQGKVLNTRIDSVVANLGSDYTKKSYTIVSGTIINGTGRVTTPSEGNYISQDIPVRAGTKVKLINKTTQAIPANAYTLFAYKDVAQESSGTSVKFAFSDGYNIEFTVPEGITIIRFRILLAAWVADLSLLELQIQDSLRTHVDLLMDEVEKLGTSVIHVSKTGNDSNDGSKSMPVLTINKAFELVSANNQTIMIGAGDYRESLDWRKLKYPNVLICTNSPEAEVRILGSDAVPFAKTSGRTKIYEASHTTASSYKRAYLLDTPSLEQTMEEDFPQTNGVKYRLPYTRFVKIPEQSSLSDALDYLDANPGGFYYDSDGGKIYVSSDLNLDNISLEIPVRNTTTGLTAATDVRPNIKMQNIGFYFSTDTNWGAIDTNYFNSIELDYCKAYGCYSTNFYLNVMNSKLIGCVSGDSLKDGFANQYYNTDYTTLPWDKGYRALYVNCWAHDNFDDGFSHHARGKAMYIGCLAEHCETGDGFADVNGSQTECIDCVAYKCSYGFNVACGVNDNRISTSMLVQGCLSKQNNRGFGFSLPSDSANNAIMTIISSISESDTTGYYCGNASGFTAKVICYDCKVLNAGTAKNTTGTGIIDVKALESLN